MCLNVYIFNIIPVCQLVGIFVFITFEGRNAVKVCLSSHEFLKILLRKIFGSFQFELVSLRMYYNPSVLM